MDLSSRLFKGLFLVALCASALLIAGCGSSDDESGRPDDPKAAIEQGLDKLGELKTGAIDGNVSVTLSGPISVKAVVAFKGPFDVSEPATPGYAFDGSFKWGTDPAEPFALAAKDATRYVTVEGDSFSHKGEPNEEAQNPLGEIAGEVKAMLSAHKDAGAAEGEPGDDVKSYSATIDPEMFQEAAFRLFNNLLQPGAGSEAVSAGQVQSILETAIREAEANFAIDAAGVIRSIGITTNGGYEILGSTQRIRLGVDLGIDRQDQPVTIDVPADATAVDSGVELDEKFTKFFTSQIKIGF